MAAVRWLIIPVQVGKWALAGMGHLFETIDLVRQRLNPDLSVLGILCTMYRSRTVLSKEVLETLRERFGDLVFKTVIGLTVRLGEAALMDRPVLQYAGRSDAAQNFRQLAEEVEERCRTRRRSSGSN